MTGQFMPNLCDNMNHRRADAPVAHCPNCGGVVNHGLRAQSCTEGEHAAARKRLTTFCVRCGVQLIFSR